MMDERLKAQVRLALFDCAARGRFLTYEEFYELVRPGQKMGQFPLKAHFNAVAREERQLGYPDITFLVHRKGPPPQYPSQIDFTDAEHPTTTQIQTLRDGADEIIRLYCPAGTRHPY
jgi:hypothetical protein